MLNKKRYVCHTNSSSFSFDSNIPISKKKYELLKILGWGSLAEVYLANCIGENKDIYYAIKIFIPRPIEYFNFLEKYFSIFDSWESEYEIIQRVKDIENSIKIKAAIFTDNIINKGKFLHKITNSYSLPCLIFNYYRSVIYNIQYKMNVDEIKLYCYKLLIFLKNIHEVGVIHADIKPENIFVDIDHGLAVGDFGNSILKEDSKMYINSNLTTIYYRAPERFDLPNEVKEKIDVYSMGCVFYFLYTGDTIFYPGNYYKGIDPVEMRRGYMRVIKRKIYDKKLIKLLKGMLNFYPKYRYSVIECIGSDFFSEFKGEVNGNGKK
jgi:serine/threonine protein kinase